MIVIPAHLFPKNALELWLIVSAIPEGLSVVVTAIEDRVVHWVAAA